MSDVHLPVLEIRPIKVFRVQSIVSRRSGEELITLFRIIAPDFWSLNVYKYQSLRCKLHRVSQFGRGHIGIVLQDRLHVAEQVLPHRMLGDITQVNDLSRAKSELVFNHDHQLTNHCVSLGL